MAAKKKTGTKTASKKKAARKQSTKKQVKKPARKTTVRKTPAKGKKTGKKKTVKKKTVQKKSAGKAVAKKKTGKKKTARKAAAKKAAKKITGKRIAAKKKKTARKKTAKKAAKKTTGKRIATKKKKTASKSAAGKTKSAKKIAAATGHKRGKADIHSLKKKFPRRPVTEVQPFSPYRAERGEEYMNAAQTEHFRTILQDWKKLLMEEVDRTVHHMQDEAANFPDPNDRATQEEEFALELRTRDRERKLIRKIDEAILSLETGDYGYCEVCGVEIGIKRLEARPTATLCIDCKTLDEIKEKQFG